MYCIYTYKFSRVAHFAVSWPSMNFFVLENSRLSGLAQWFITGSYREKQVILENKIAKILLIHEIYVPRKFVHIR